MNTGIAAGKVANLWHNQEVSRLVQVDLYSSVSLRTGFRGSVAATTAEVRVALQLLKACIFVSDFVDVHNPLPRRAESFEEVVDEVLNSVSGLSYEEQSTRVALLREAQTLHASADVQWSVDRYTEILDSFRSGYEVEGLDAVQSMLFRYAANPSLGLRSLMSRLSERERGLLISAATAAEMAVDQEPSRRGFRLDDTDAVFLILRAHKLLTSRALATVLDTQAEAELANLMQSGVIAQESLPVTLAGRALSIAPLYVLRAVPHIAEFEVDLLLSWRSMLTESLKHYREATIVASRAASDVTYSDTDAYLISVGRNLDGLYRELLDQVQSSTLWTTTRERASSFLGPIVPAGIALAVTPSQPVVALSALVGGSVSQALVITAEALRRSRAMRRNALYWRFALGAIDV